MNAMEIVHDGWLTKSPPEKRIWKAKWRRRWFILRHSGQLPGQFILEYYTDPTKRKLKGKIDLDQCEQVDSGLTFDARKFDQMYRFIFDIRTPKRTYYLVAETEPEMIRWVDSICSVCGLKIHMEDEFESSSQPAVTNTNSNNNNVCPSSNRNTPEVRPGNTNNVDNYTNEPDSPSGQYIFISDCLSGTPISNSKNVNQLTFNLNKDGIGSMPDEPPPPPPKASPDRLVSGEFYDYPRPLQPVLPEEDSSLDSEVSGHLPPIRTPTTPSAPGTPFKDSIPQFGWNSVPPRVNWNTYPADSVMSTLEMHQILEVPNKVGPHQECIDNVTVTLRRASLQDSEDQHRASQEADMSNSIVGDLIPPPRPPKPANLGDNRKYENTSPNLGISSNFHPNTSTLPLSSAKDVSHFDELSPDSKVPPPSANSIISADDLYDFPRPLHEGVVDIAQSPPAPQMNSVGSLHRPRRHAYSNAPAGYIDDETNVFRYDTNATDSVSSQSYISMDAGKPIAQHGDLYTEMSGDSHSTPSLTPTTPGAVYCNVSPGIPGSLNLVDVPPIVNRNLKPRKKVMDGDAKGETDLLTLAPPPACRLKSDSQQGFSKPLRNVPSPSALSQNSHILPHRLRNSDQSSDDDMSSICDSPRNSTDAERKFPMPLKKSDSEIQYLDLDLDLEAAQVVEVKSPKTPDKSSSSTVYKTVDFIKTKAFNETRQNVETYRKKSQS